MWGDSMVDRDWLVLWVTGSHILSSLRVEESCSGTLLHRCSPSQTSTRNSQLLLEVASALSWEETGHKPHPVFNLFQGCCGMQMFCYSLSCRWEPRWDLHLLCCKAKFSLILTVYFGPKSFPFSQLPLTVQLISLAWTGAIDGIKETHRPMWLSFESKEVTSGDPKWAEPITFYIFNDCLTPIRAFPF